MTSVARRAPFLLVLLGLLAAMLVGVAAPAQASGLTSLTLVDTDITMRPDATPNTFINVAPAATTQTHILASFADGAAEYTVDGGAAVALLADDSSVAVPVHVGLTTIVVTHTAADTTVSTYTVYIKNQVLMSNIEVETSSGTVSLTPTFDPATFTYSIAVPHDDTAGRIRSTWNTSADPTISAYAYRIGGGPSGGTTSGTWSNWKDLNVGDNRWCPTVIATTAQGNTPEVGVGYANDYYCITITRADAFGASTLSAISFDDSAMQSPGGTLRPTGTPFEFYAFPEWGATQTHLTATFAAGSATYAVDGVSGGSLTSGTRSSSIGLHAGDNIVTITHTAPDTTVTTYTVHVLSRQLLQNIEVETSSGTVSLTPTFDPTTFTYAIAVPHDDTVGRVKSTWATGVDPSITSYTYKIGSGPSGGTTSGTWSNWKDLTVGANRWCPTLVATTAVSSIPQLGVGYTNDYYCITITRADAFSASTLSAISFDDSAMQTPGGTLRPTATPFEFYAFPEWGATQTHLTATFAAGSATYAVDGVAGGSLTSGARSDAIALHAGDNVVTITHTAPDTTVTTYTVHVLSRQLLENVELETGTGPVDSAPAFSPTTFTYTVTVPHDDTVVRFRSTWATGVDPSITSYSYRIGGGPSGGTTSGTWSNYGSLIVGDNRMCPTLVATTAVSSIPQLGVGYANDYYCYTITRATAFATITSVSVPGVPTAGTPVPAGSAISVTPAGVTGTPTPTVTYDWEAADDTTFTSSSVVATTTTPSWTPPNSVANKYVRVTATADNGVSTPTTATSDAFGPIAAVDEAPGISGAVVSGVAEEGQPLSASASGVTGYPTPTLGYRWEASTDGSTYAAISGATGASLTPGADLVGQQIRVVITVGNGVGSDASATSSATAAVVAREPDAAPVPIVVPRPGAPTAVTASAGDGSARVVWSAVESSDVEVYEVAASPGGARCRATTTQCVIDGLTNGTPYTFTVRARNAAGWGAWSEASAAVTPEPAVAPTPTPSPEPTLSIKMQTRGKGMVVVKGTATGLGDGTVVRIRVAKYRAKGQRWAKYRTVERVRVVDGAFTAEVKGSKRIRVIVKAKGAPRTEPIVLVRGRPIA